MLMGMLLFNIVGYRAVFSWMEEQAHQQLNQQLDTDNQLSQELITIKVPIDGLPYYTNSPIFERTKGSITLGGMTYQYVERRIYNDSLEMRCIPNAQATQLTNARDLFFQLVNDLQHTNSEGKQSPVKPSIAFKNLFSDFTLASTTSYYEPVFRTTQTEYQLYQAIQASSIRTPQEQPPDNLQTV